LKLENFGISTAKANTSPDEMEIFSFCFDSSKTNTEGHIETNGAARHLDALLCPVSSFFMSMMWRFTPQLGGMTFPISVDMVESSKGEGTTSLGMGTLSMSTSMERRWAMKVRNTSLKRSW